MRTIQTNKIKLSFPRNVFLRDNPEFPKLNHDTKQIVALGKFVRGIVRDHVIIATEYTETSYGV